MIGFFVFVLTLAVIFVAVVAGIRWLRLDGRELPPGRVVSPAQLDRVESALSALEARLDELQDQQRFLERLLADRQEPGALPPAEAGRRKERSRESESGEDGAEESILFDPELRREEES